MRNTNQLHNNILSSSLISSKANYTLRNRVISKYRFSNKSHYDSVTNQSIESAHNVDPQSYFVQHTRQLHINHCSQSLQHTKGSFFLFLGGGGGGE